MNQAFRREFLNRGWESEVRIFEELGEPLAKIDFMKDRIGVEVSFSHSSFLGVDMLKFQMLSYSNLDRIDVRIYIMQTKGFFGRKFKGSIKFGLIFDRCNSSSNLCLWIRILETKVCKGLREE